MPTVRERQDAARKAKRERNTRVAAMLADGVPIPQIVKETGLSQNRVYVMRRKLQSAAGDAAAVAVAEPEPSPVPEPELRQEQDAPAVLVDNTERIIQAAYSNGVALEEIAAAFDMDVSDIELPAQTKQAALVNKARVLGRLQVERPAQWLRSQMEQEAAIAKRQAEQRIDRDKVVALVGDIMNHQTRLLTEDDMRDWVGWLKELTVTRYPELA